MTEIITQPCPQTPMGVAGAQGGNGNVICDHCGHVALLHTDGGPCVGCCAVLGWQDRAEVAALPDHEAQETARENVAMQLRISELEAECRSLRTQAAKVRDLWRGWDHDTAPSNLWVLLGQLVSQRTPSSSQSGSSSLDYADSDGRTVSMQLVSNEQLSAAYDTVRSRAAIREEEYQELLACIWLYVKWRYVTGKLTTEQRELWAEAIETTSERDHPGEGSQVDRWWSE